MNQDTFLGYKLPTANELFPAIHQGVPCLLEIILAPGENQQNCYPLAKDLLWLVMIIIIIINFTLLLGAVNLQILNFLSMTCFRLI